MQKTLEDRGWFMFYECITCGHRKFYNHKDHPGYEIRTREQSNTFSVMLNNQVVEGPKNHWDLLQTLKNKFPDGK